MTLAVALWVVALFLGVFWLRPYETNRTFGKLRLRLGGVKRVQAASLAAWEKNTCATGKPCRCVALIHGLGDSAGTWDKVLLGNDGAAPPPPDVRLLAVDLPGSEGSLPPASPSGYAIPAMADSVQEALQSRCSEWTVAGNSLGGWVAAWLAIKWPEGVKRLVLINAAGLADPTGIEIETARVLQDPTVEKMQAFSKRAYFKPPTVPDRAWPGLVAAIKARPTARICAALDPKDLLDGRAALIKAPTVVLWGLADKAIPEAVGRGFARLIHGARFVGLDQCGHLPQRECPSAVSKVLYGD